MGGALVVPPRSCWDFLGFVWTAGKHWCYDTKEDIPGNISINTIDDSRHEILTQYKAWEAQETLGLFLAMNYNNTEETQYFLRETAKEYADCVGTGFLSYEDATYALHCTIIKTLEYPMAATTINKLKKWDYMMAPILKMTLPCMDYVRSSLQMLSIPSRIFANWASYIPAGTTSICRK
jgi:hypothetical protein